MYDVFAQFERFVVFLFIAKDDNIADLRAQILVVGEVGINHNVQFRRRHVQWNLIQASILVLHLPIDSLIKFGNFFFCGLM
jgi:hypothetical protein